MQQNGEWDGVRLTRFGKYDKQATNMVNCGVSIIPRHTHTHTRPGASHASHHQDLDLVLLVGPVEEGDAGVLAQEGGRPGDALGVLDLLQQLHDLLRRAVLLWRQGLGIGGGRARLG